MPLQTFASEPTSSPWRLRSRGWRAVALVLVLGLVPACGTDATGPTWRYAAWDGGAAFDLPKPRLPALLRVGGHLGLTSDSLSDTVTVVDLDTRKVLATLPIGRNPVDVDGPYHLGFDRKNNVLHVALAYPSLEGGGTHGHGASTRPGWVQQWRLSPFELLAERLVDSNPADVGLSADGSRLVVAHFDLVRAGGPASRATQRAVLSVFQPVGPGVLPVPVEVPVCVAPHGVALSRPDGATAWVACYGEDALAVVSLAGTPTTTLVPMPEGQGAPGAPIVGPYAVRLDPMGNWLAVTTNVSLDVQFFDVAKQAFVGKTVPMLATPMWPVWSAQGDRLWVPTQHADAVKVVAAKTGTVTAERVFLPGQCRRPHEAVLTADGHTLWVVCEGNGKTPGKLLALDPESLVTLGEVAVGLRPVHLVVVSP